MMLQKSLWNLCGEVRQDIRVSRSLKKYRRCLQKRACRRLSSKARSSSRRCATTSIGTRAAAAENTRLVRHPTPDNSNQVDGRDSIPVTKQSGAGVRVLEPQTRGKVGLCGDDDEHIRSGWTSLMLKVRNTEGFPMHCTADPSSAEILCSVSTDGTEDSVNFNEVFDILVELITELTKCKTFRFV